MSMTPPVPPGLPAALNDNATWEAREIDGQHHVCFVTGGDVHRILTVVHATQPRYQAAIAQDFASLMELRQAMANLMLGVLDVVDETGMTRLQEHFERAWQAMNAGRSDAEASA